MYTGFLITLLKNKKLHNTNYISYLFPKAIAVLSHRDL